MTTMPCRVGPAITLLLLLVGCGNRTTAELTTLPNEATRTSVTASSMPTTAATTDKEADVQLIEQLWRDYSNSWFGGFEDGIQYVVNHNYPYEECTFADYMAVGFPDGPVDGFRAERIVDATSIERDPEWLIQGGPLDGTPAQGRVYIMSTTSTFSATGYEPTNPVTEEVHVTILAGDVFFFFNCFP